MRDSCPVWCRERETFIPSSHHLGDAFIPQVSAFRLVFYSAFFQPPLSQALISSVITVRINLFMVHCCKNESINLMETQGQVLNNSSRWHCVGCSRHCISQLSAACRCKGGLQHRKLSRMDYSYCHRMV